MIRNIYILLLLAFSFGTVTDIDGNVYETVQIGEQLWMAENLKVTHYNNGDEIPTGYSDEEWNNLSSSGYTVYPADNDWHAIEACGYDCADVFGNLYNWFAAKDNRGICPEGWNIPTDDEYKILEMNVGMGESEANGTGYRGTNEGSKLAGQAALWREGDLKDDSEFGTSGFNTLAAGFRQTGNGYYLGIRSNGYFWTSSEYNSEKGWFRMFRFSDTDIGRNGAEGPYGFSVRCLQDDIEGCTHPNATNYDETANVDDGNCEYETVQIGHQVWMTENLKATHYRNGDAIATGLSDSEWINASSGAFAIYNDDPSNAEVYGNLYNWYAVDDSRGICPEGFQVPSDEEWQELEIYLGMSQEDANSEGWRGTDEGASLKSSGTVVDGDGLWDSPNSANNESGYSAFPAGYRDKQDGQYYQKQMYGYYRTSSDWIRWLLHNEERIAREINSKIGGLSVRCLSDETQTTTLLVPENFATIQEAIDYSIDGDTILVSAGTYFENINFNGKNIAVIGEDRETTIIDGGQNGGVVAFINGEDSTATLSSFTIQNGSYNPSTTTGGIFIGGSNPNIIDLLIKDNSSAEAGGGGLTLIVSNPLIQNVEVSYNEGASGGGLFMIWSDPVLDNVNIMHNTSSGSGGGVAQVTSNPIINNVTISNNISETMGGGLYINGANLNISGYTVDNNTAEIGGGVYLECGEEGDVSISNMHIVSNAASEEGAPSKGGGLSIIDCNNFTIDSLLIEYNQMDYGKGSGVYIENSSGTMNNTIINNNSGATYGGGIMIQSDSEVVFNNINVENNDASNGGGIYIWESNTVFNNILVNNNTGSDGAGIYSEESTCTFIDLTISNNIGNIRIYKDYHSELSFTNVVSTNNILSQNYGFVLSFESLSVDINGGKITDNVGLGISVSGSININNVTIANNSGWGILIASLNANINNSIIWGNSGYQIRLENNFSGSEYLNIKYSDIEDGEGGVYINSDDSEVIWGDGNIDADPLFTDPDNGDYTLQPLSDCIDTGDPESELDPDGSRSDMGAYYFHQESNTLNIDEGANLMSFSVLPRNGLDDLPNDISGIIGAGVAATNLPPWSGSLQELRCEDGYWLINSGSAFEWDYFGIPCPDSLIYNLIEGANLISYSNDESGSLSDVLPDDVEDCLSGIIGQGVASNNMPPWAGSLTTLEPNKGYWFKSNCEIDFQYDEPTALARLETPKTSLYPYNQSTQQAFYFIESIENIEQGDIIHTYSNGINVGSRVWNGGFTDVPAMGDDGSKFTAGYCISGSIPTFKVEKANGSLITLTGDIPEWSNNQLYMVGYLEESIALPAVYSLSTAYPNPFNPTTTLSFAIPVDSEVFLSIYNLQGREVSTLIEGNMDAGYHSVIWNADSYSSGVYFVKMVAGEFVNTQKLMLVK